MDSEHEGMLLNSCDRVSRCFQNFMTRVAKFDEQTEAGNRFLNRFRQELEIFRKPEPNRTCEVVDRIIRANNTERMMKYVEAGWRHSYADMQNTRKLVSCQEGLHEHLKKVKALLDELEGLSVESIGMVEALNNNTLLIFDQYSSGGVKHQEYTSGSVSLDSVIVSDAELVENPEFSLLKEMEAINIPFERILYYASMIRVIYNMFNLDYEMQEKIVLSLNLDSSFDELVTYCLMWELRPFIDDKVMQQCWKVVR